MVYVGVWTATISSTWALLGSSSTDHLVQLIVSQVVVGISDFEDLITTLWENIRNMDGLVHRNFMMVPDLRHLS